ncbi:MAG: GspE/PulE family protein [Lentisphaeria bacterium]|nr:GspE/PulE family protein [Lentisphaeria bacterium]NQZ67061.1 GspE/PulE family protein [Lentisphaeria bacterium]
MSDGETIQQNAILNNLYNQIQDAETLESILYGLERDILHLVQGERLTMYRKDSSGQNIISFYHSGADVSDPITVPLGPSSIAGFVALNGEPLLIRDVYNTDELAEIHPSLAFEYSYDETTGYITQSMIVVPIKHEQTVLGVIQIINHKQGGTFTEQDVIHCYAISQLVAKKFKWEFKTNLGPYQELVNKELLTLDQFEDFERESAESGVPITVYFRRKANIEDQDIASSLQNYYGVPYMGYDPEIPPEEDILKNLNRNYLASNNWVPFRSAKGSLVILIDNPNDIDRTMEVQQLVNDMDVDFKVGTRETILRYLGYVFPEDEDMEEVSLDDIVGQIDNKIVDASSSGDDDDKNLLDENQPAIIRLVNHIIIEAIELDASDIHIEPGIGKLDSTVRMRVDGQCSVRLKIPATHIRAVVSRIKVLSKLDITERRLPQDGKMAVRMDDQPLELRIATVPTVQGESVVMRILASAGKALPMDKLNLHPEIFEKIEHCLEHPHGIMLVVGPTGSGKTTTLHALLGKINTEERKILTAEDPVEITQPGLQQVQMMPRIGLTFATAMRAFLRADPDVILIGEMRDEETASIGVEASLTGHLVFSTLHTNSAPETVIRLLDIGLDPINFADAFIGVLAQRLVRTLCGACKEPYTAPKEEVDKLIHFYGDEQFDEMGYDRNEIILYKPVGCEKCTDTGYKGRTGIHELMVGTGEVKRLISKTAPVPELKAKAIEEGMRTLMQDGIWKILRGETDIIQLRKVTVE